MVSYFDILLLAYVALAAVALYLVRVSTFILAGNNLLVARAFAAIDRGGPPGSMGFLPAQLFAPENLTTAATILTIMLVALVIATLLVRRGARLRFGPDAPAVPKPMLIVIGLYLLAYAGSASTIASGGYAGDADIRYDLELGGGHTFLCSLVLYELVRRRLLGLITGRKAFLAMFLIFTATGYAKGGTGLTTGYLVSSAILLLPRTGSAHRFKNMLHIGVLLMGILALSFVVRGVRANLATQGTEAVSSFLDDIVAMERGSSETGEGAENVANATQSASHMLMCIDLYDRGISREWRSIYNIVEYTLMPSFFVRWFEWKRSIEPAWELRDHYIHGGGINVLGELYWNGGYLCVVIMCMVLALFCAVVDTRYRASPLWLIIAAQFAPSLLMGYGYGFPQVARGAINGLVATAAYLIYSMVWKQQSIQRTTDEAANVTRRETTVAHSLGQGTTLGV